MAFTDTWTICPKPAEGAVIRGEGWRVADGKISLFQV